MPIRFRCDQCGRLLGISRRKAGHLTRCPQCGAELVVPSPLDDDPVVSEPIPLTAADEVPPAPPPPVAATRRPPPPAAGVRTHPQRATDLNEAPLFIGDDIDRLLGVPNKPDPKPADAKAGKSVVSGMDAMSLDDGAAKPIVLSPQRATILLVGLVVLLGVAFALGIVVGMNTSRG